LHEVIARLSVQTQVNIWLDEIGLEKEGVHPQVPITIEVSEDISLRSALGLITKPLHLKAIDDGGHILITSQSSTRDAYRASYDIVKYTGIPLNEMNYVIEILQRRWKSQDESNRPAGKFLNSDDKLIALIRDVGQDSSDQAGFPRKVVVRSPDRTKLLVWGVPNVHDDVIDVLSQLNRFGEGVLHAKRMSARRQLAVERDSQFAQDAAQLKFTDIHPHSEAPIVAGRNYVYCSTFQLAWSALQSNVLREPVSLEGNHPLVSILNQSPRDDRLDPFSYLALAGKADAGIVDQISEAMRKQFPRARINLPEAGSANSLIAFAYLYKQLHFEEPFFVADDPVRFHARNGEVRVEAFGLVAHEHRPRAEQVREQVTVLDYHSDDDFILQLHSSSPKDEIILAKLPPRPSLQNTIDHVQQRIVERAAGIKKKRIEWDETLAIPLLDIHVERDYKELLGRALLNPGWESYYVSTARQMIRFRLDEEGAVLESFAELEEMEALLGDSEPPPKPRQFIFDKPFLIFLKQADAPAPYFAMWVENLEVLVPAEK